MLIVVTGDEEASAEISITSNLVNSAEFWRLFVLLCPSVSKVTLLIVQITPPFVKKIRCFLDDKTETKRESDVDSLVLFPVSKILSVYAVIFAHDLCDFFNVTVTLFRCRGFSHDTNKWFCT